MTLIEKLKAALEMPMNVNPESFYDTKIESRIYDRLSELHGLLCEAVCLVMSCHACWDGGTDIHPVDAFKSKLESYLEKREG